MTGAMTKADRDNLIRVARLNTKVALAALKQRSADLQADLERKLAAHYSYNQDEIWAAAAKAAKRAVAEADERVKERCRELGIPDAFRPGITFGWYGRGETAVRSRREELRKIGLAEIDAMERRGRTEIERRSAEIQTRLVAGSLESDEARAFLESIPSADQLMPPITIEAIEGNLTMLDGRRA
jgi:hypothetical protein